ncbi:MAG: hypothetical protein HXY21_07635 [Parvularculaceae bacterium]|nr:hypothetical protein [Parvularculaceae bacterium]
MAQQDDLTRLGLYAVAPFVFGAAILWLSPIIVPQWAALNVHTLILAYGGIIAAFFAGAAASGALHAGDAARAAPFLAAALIAWFAIWPSGFLYFSVPAVWRYLILILVFLWLSMRGSSHSAYGAVRQRMTFWIAISLVIIMARLIVWRHY